MELNGREKALVERGYDEELVSYLSNFTKEELDYAIEVGFSRISKNVTPVSDPVAIFVGGQPGSGKSIETMRIKKDVRNIVEVNIDMYRSYHPRYLEIEKAIKEHWNGRMTSENDTPGNDIADFTHRFVSDISDALIAKASEEQEDNKRYNMVVEWGMRDAKVPLQTMTDLKNKGYKNVVKYICVHKDTSLEACSLRADVMMDGKHIIRKSPASFHEFYIKTLPDGMNEIYKEGFSSGVLDEMYLTLRDGSIVWDHTSEKLPGEIFEKCLNDEKLKTRFSNSKELAQMNNDHELDYLNSSKVR